MSEPNLVCARCDGPVIDRTCAPCKTTNGPIRGVIGEDMAGAEWTDVVTLGRSGDTRLQETMRCAVTVGGEYGPAAWVQVQGPHRYEGCWSSQGIGCVTSTIFRAWGAAMLARAQRAEWLIEEHIIAKRCAPRGAS